MAETIEHEPESEETRHWRRMRDDYNRRFKSIDALCDHIERLEKNARARRTTGSAAARTRRRPARSARGKSANSKTVHKS